MLNLAQIMQLGNNVALFLVLTVALGTQSSSVQSRTPDTSGLHAKIGLGASETGFLNARNNRTDEAEPLIPYSTSSGLQCGATVQATSKSDKYEVCPSSCPYWAQNKDDHLHCTFLCVAEGDCAKWNPNKPIADTTKESRACRGPRMNFCSEMYLDGTDSCRRCQWGFDVHLEDGGCYFKYWGCLISFILVLVIIVAILVVWVVDMCCRTPTNEDTLKEALQWRTRSKILMPKQDSGHRTVYPSTTNLCRQDVAGPGMALHFNFQVFVIVWALFVAVLWTILASFHNELFILGTRRFGTPRHNCILVAWGYETQHRLMWTKVAFLAIVYVVTFIACLVFAVYQTRLYYEMDANDKTYKDFAVELTGLPKLPADHKDVEKIILEAVFRATGKKAVGVSVGWDYSECVDEVLQTVQESRGEESPRTDQINHSPPSDMGPIHRKMYAWESWLLGPDGMIEVDPRALLGKMQSSDTAYVVFSNEEDKEHVLKTTRGIMFDPRECLHGAEECLLEIQRVSCEPAAINWQYFGDNSRQVMTNRFISNFFKLYIPALAVWFFVFYVPYAVSLYNFNYDNGAELPSYYGLVFTMVVVGGNATMYVICDMCAENMCFRYKDTKQVVYVLMYLFACAFNVLLDMVVTYFTARKIMVGLDFRTYDGRPLSEVDSFTEEFETYAMQRTLAENTYAYAFPSTFLVPFLLEPFVTILVPLWIGQVIIRTHRDIRGTDAEPWIAAFDFDLGRYADILLNVFLGILIFYFPGGYTWTLFYGMFFSHIVIYAFDHWRVLNVIPNVKIVSYDVDWWAQLMLIPCCSLIVSCLVFKANCEPYADFCLKDMSLISITTMAGVAHFIVHLFLFAYLVPVLSGGKRKNRTMMLEYKDVAERDAHSWFAVNPVHCLRSQYIHNDKPYCRFASVGKEHLLEINKKIGCYFKDDPAEFEEFSLKGEVKSFGSLLNLHHY